MLRRSFVMALAVACLVPLSNRLQAQQVVTEQVVIQASSQGGGTLMAPIVMRVAGEGGATYSFSAPMALYSASAGVYGGLSFVPNDPMTMLRLPQFGEELELVDSQLEQLRQLQAETTKLQQAMYAEMRVPPGQSQTNWQVRQTLMRQKQTEMREKTQARLDEILLPHQQQRLRELRFQMDLRNRGVNALTAADLADALGLTDEQKRQLAQKQAESQRKLQEAIQKLREEFRAEIIGQVLTESQRRKLQQLAGETYEMRPPDYGAMRNRASSNRSTGKKSDSAEKRPEPTEKTEDKDP